MRRLDLVPFLSLVPRKTLGEGDIGAGKGSLLEDIGLSHSGDLVGQE